MVLVMTFLILLNSSTVAMAINDDNRGRSGEVNEMKQGIIEDKKGFEEKPGEDLREVKTTITTQKKTMWTEMKRKQVKLIIERIQTELDLRYKIILKLKEKIGERITKKSATHNMATASAKLTQFSETQYQTDVTALKAKLTEITASDTPKSLLPGVKEAANKVRVSLRSMHQFLVEVMKLVATAPEK